MGTESSQRSPRRYGVTWLRRLLSGLEAGGAVPQLEGRRPLEAGGLSFDLRRRRSCPFCGSQHNLLEQARNGDLAVPAARWACQWCRNLWWEMHTPRND